MTTLITLLLLISPATQSDLERENFLLRARVAALEYAEATRGASTPQAGAAPSGQDAAPVSVTDEYATPQPVVDRILKYLHPSRGEVFGDIGCGDGRVVISAARDYGCEAWGIERDHDRVQLARRNAEAAGVEDLVTIIEGDFTEVEWPYADVGYAYLFPEDLAAIKDNLLRFDRFASFAHVVPGLNMWSQGDGEFYTWEYHRPFAWWNDRAYTSASCNNLGCSMCNSIRADIHDQIKYRAAVLASQKPAQQTEHVYMWVKRCNGRQCWWEKVIVR